MSERELTTVEIQRGRFGAYLTAILKQRYLTQTEFARMIGVDQSQVSKWSRGARVPDVPHAKAIAETLGLPAYEVLRMASHVPSELLEPNEHPERVRLKSLIDRLDPTTLKLYADLMERHLSLIDAVAADESRDD
ncbi:MAG: helix-turn-helix transcriptional regulator [Thermomicrobiales bacterium]